MSAIRQVMKQYIALTMLNSVFMGFTSSTYVVFMKHYGLDLFQQGIVNFCFFLTLTIMEIPTGVVADVYGRKFSYLISCGLATIGLMIYGFATTMSGFILAEVVLAIGVTFSSGAFRAWFVDRLHHFKHDGSLSNVFARVSRFGVVAAVISAIAGSYLYEFSPALPWFAGAIFSAVAGIYGALCREEYFVREKKTFTHKIHFLTRALVDFRRDISRPGPFRFIVVVSFALYFLIAAPNMHWQPFFGAHFGNDIVLGYMYAAIRASIFIGVCSAPIILKYVRCERKSIILMQIIIAISLMFTAYVDTVWVAGIAFIIHEVGRGAITPITDAYLHDNIVDARQRATIDSCASMVYRCAGAIGLLFGGFVAKHFGISFAWMIMSIILVAATITVALKEKKRK